MSNELSKIDFHGDEIIAFEEENKIYVSVQQACISIGVKVETQVKKIRNDPVYQAGLKVAHMPDLFGNQGTPFLERKYFHKLLNSISTAKVKDDVVREKLLKYQLECIDAVDSYFHQGFAINEKALNAMPTTIINGIAELIKEQLGIPTGEEVQIELQRKKLALSESRMLALKTVSDTLGEFDYETKTTLQKQAIADIYGAHPAPTWIDMNRWYAADYWKTQKEEGWTNAYYQNEQELVKILGRKATLVSKKEGLEIISVPQVLSTGRKIAVNQYREVTLEEAFLSLIEEGKVIQQTKIIPFEEPRTSLLK